MGYGDKKYTLTVKDPRTGEAITSGVLAMIYNAGTKTLSTLYSNDARTSLANPITRTQFAADDKVEFYTAQTTVDIFIADDKGNVSFIPSVSPTEHTLHLNRDGVNKCLVIPFSPNTSETDTGIDLPLNVWVYDAMIEVVTVDATETMDLGLLSTETAGDANGILTGVPMDTAGFIKPWSVTDSTTEDYVSSPYWGALMGIGTAGTSAATDQGQPGGPGHVISGSNARSITYTHSAGSDTAAGYIYVFFKHLR